METNNSIVFARVITEDVLDFINSAKGRILYVKPAFLKEEVEALLNAVEKKNVICDLYMEAGDNAIRFGFGDVSALELINKHLNSFNIHITDRIRIAILIVDDRTLIYMPNINFIEEESKELTFPNGILGNKNVTDEIINQFLSKNKNINLTDRSENVIMFPGEYIPEFDNKEIKDDIEVSVESLKNNPPVDPSKLKRINFYRNNYKILKMQVLGVRIENKRINLNPFYTLLPEIDKKLKSSWSILSAEDIKKLQDTKCFDRELNKIIEEYKDYLFDAGRFGFIIDVIKKEEFTKKIIKLKDDFKSYLNNKTTDENVKKRFSCGDDSINNKKDLKTLLEDSKAELEKHLLSMCPNSDEFLNKIFYQYRHLKSEYKKNNNKKEVHKKFVERFVMDKLRFTEVEEVIGRIDIKLDYYDISDELIFYNEDFSIIIKKYNLEPRQTSVGYEGN